MNKPSLPSKPKEPKLPTQVYHETYEASYSFINETLADLLVAIELETTQAVGWPISRRKVGPVPHDKVTFAQDYDESRAIWQQTIEVTLTDDEFKIRMAKYELAMTTYRAKLVEYDAKVKAYEIDLRAYLDHKRQIHEERERALLADLQVKYPKP